MPNLLFIGSDYDKTLTAKGQEDLDPVIARELKKRCGKTISLMLVTGRFAGQMKAIGGTTIENILKAHKIHIYAGGSMVSDGENNIIDHSNRKLEDDQIEAISSTAFNLMQIGAEPLIVFQAAEQGIHKPTGWTNDEMHILFTNHLQLTERRRAMYTRHTPMPKNVKDIAAAMRLHNPAKVIIVSESFLENNQGHSVQEMADNLSQYNLGVTGNHKSGVDITRQEANKAAGIEIALNFLGASYLDQYFGDSIGPLGNDTPAFMASHIIRNGIFVFNGGDDEPLPELDFDMPIKIVRGTEGLAKYLASLEVEG